MSRFGFHLVTAITAVGATCECRCLFQCAPRCIAPLRCITPRRLPPWSALLHRFTAMCGAKFVTTDIIDTTVTAIAVAHTAINLHTVMAVTVIVTEPSRE